MNLSKQVFMLAGKAAEAILDKNEEVGPNTAATMHFCYEKLAEVLETLAPKARGWDLGVNPNLDRIFKDGPFGARYGKVLYSGKGPYYVLEDRYLVTDIFGDEEIETEMPKIEGIKPLNNTRAEELWEKYKTKAQ